ncbi:helix-turn-helix transcriptional regulator [Dokdonia sp.]|uniref:helix-turn-helix domain-containing protein n=1 Tax=Dokdonia sp. TaxID=2024995 RepID=UPI003266BE46
MIVRRKELGMTQEDVNHKLGVADRLVSKWECGMRTPTSFNLHCWAQVLEGVIVFETQTSQTTPNLVAAKKGANDNFKKNKASNDNKKTLSWRKLIKN